MNANTWSSLPHDLLVEILRRLAATAVVRCAGTCRPWRRAVIGNASCLRPRPDRFNPNLLIGFFYTCRWSSSVARLQYVPGPFENLFAKDAGGTAWDIWMNDHHPHRTSISYLLPWSACHGVHVEQYDQPLSSRDGFLLLGGGTGSKVTNLCLCNLLARTCRFIPSAKLGAFNTCTYVVVTADDDGDSATAVWILAVRWEDDVKRGVIYQIFSPASGEWEPVKRSAKFEKDVTKADMMSDGTPNNMVVLEGSVYWLVRLFDDGRHLSTARMCVFAIDVCTERTWTTELPEKHKVLDNYTCRSLVLAMSEDGRLSLILQLSGHWTLRRAIDLHSLIPGCPKEREVRLIISGFCPRSGVLFGDIDLKDLLIDVDKGCLRSTWRTGAGRQIKYPYVMDWSTYLSKMKYF